MVGYTSTAPTLRPQALCNEKQHPHRLHIKQHPYNICYISVYVAYTDGLQAGTGQLLDGSSRGLDTASTLADGAQANQ